jgi:N,N-dimethylformamidase
VWPKWGPSGSTGELRVHAAADYEMSLWRYGWEREHIADMGYFEDHPRGSVRQILPDGDIAASGARWNDFGYSFPPVDPRVHVTAPARSGLYYVHLRDAAGRHTAFPWVVSPSTPTEGTRVAVLASTLTWNAYNDFGGRSNYTVPKRLPARPTVNARQEDVWFTDPEFQPWDELHYESLSFNRPEPVNRVEWGDEITDPIRIRGGEHVAPAEWRLLGWLEREGFDYDLFADVQLATGDLSLDAYDVLIISTHPEYWTAGMYDEVHAWVVERGGQLCALGGNAINCEVRLEPGDQMTVLNGDLGARDSFLPGVHCRFDATHKPSAALLGVTTTFSGYETGAPYRVQDGEHWAFAGTGLKTGDSFGFESVDRRAMGGASGHETDKRNEHTPLQARLLAKGLNPDGGGGEMVCIDFSSGGRVFSVGSISYTCSVAVDDLTSRVTANVLREFLA